MRVCLSGLQTSCDGLCPKPGLNESIVPAWLADSVAPGKDKSTIFNWNDHEEGRDYPADIKPK